MKKDSYGQVKGDGMKNAFKRCMRYGVLVLSVFTLEAHRGLFLKPEIGLMKYHMRRTSLRDVSGNTDTLVPVSASVAPLMRFACGMEYDDLRMFKSYERTSGRLGVALEYARRSDAVVTNYLDSGFTVASLEGRQHIKKCNVLLIMEYDAWRKSWFTVSVGVGLGVAHDALTDLKLYQKSNGAFTGQAIEPRYLNPSGNIGIGFRGSYPGQSMFEYELNYRLGVTLFEYRDLIIQSKPDTTASLEAQNAYTLFRDLRLKQAPSTMLFSHQLSVGLYMSF